VKDIAERGTFGDMFGGLNTVFAGFAFAGLIVAILMQRCVLTNVESDVRKCHEVHVQAVRIQRVQVPSR